MHLPLELRRLLAACDQLTRPKGYPAEYDRIKAGFDCAHYLLRYPDFVAARLDPVAHFMRAGEREGRIPHPHFHPGRQAETFAAWLAQGGAEKPATTAGFEPPAEYAQTILADQAWERAEALLDTSAIPHYGVKLHRHILAAWLNSDACDYGFEYHLIKPHFDIAYYLTQNPDILAKNLDPVAHYIRAGAHEGRDPAPFFCSKTYAGRYPERVASGLTPFGAWLAAGRPADENVSPFEALPDASEALQLSERAALGMVQETYSSLRQRLEHGELGRQAAKLAEREPLVSSSWPQALDMRIAPFNSELIVNRTSDLYRMQKQAGFKTARAVILVNRPRWGSGRRMEGYLAHALAKIHGAGEVIVMTTEEGGDLPKGRLPAGIRLVDFSAVRSRGRQKERVLFELIRSMRPEAVFNINSRTCWDMLSSYGQTLCSETRVICGLFCAEQTAMGFWTGYPIRQFHKHFDKLHGVCTDSHALRGELCERFLLPQEERARISVLSAPVDPGIDAVQMRVSRRVANAAGMRRKKVFWSGRFDPQKRVDLVYEIARQMPDVDFFMWGERFLNSGATVRLERPGNVHVKGPYKAFAELPLEAADLWLYTSEWDGVPSILLEVAMAGLPIVGSDVGGTAEILKPGFSEPVAPFDDVAAYVAAIERVLRQPGKARRKAAELRYALLAERSEAAYTEAVRGLLRAPNRSRFADVEAPDDAV